jgi:formylglycine-generating enzyme
MGSEGFYPEERPIQGVEVDGFWMDEHPVTAGEFRRFVRETGYVTVPERSLDPADYPDADPSLLVPGSLVFRKSSGPVRLDDWSTDAARGGLEGAVFSWGEEEYPDGRPMANTWQGQFPWENLRLDGHEGTSPVGSFPPNGYGLYDMCGNVWEWTTDPFMSGHAEKPCCAPRVLPGERFARKVIKGGSYLCAPNYCLRYRPAARQSETVDTSTSHIGFRCVVREPPPQ